MTNDDNPAGWPAFLQRTDVQITLTRGGTALLLLSVLAVQPVVAQNSGAAFCQTNMALTIRNLFTIIQFGATIGGLIALGAIVATPMIRRADLKKEIKGSQKSGDCLGRHRRPARNGDYPVPPHDVVAGGVSCGF